MYPFGETVTRKRGQKVSDPYGADVIDWSLPTDDLEIVGVGLAPRTDDEVGGPARGGVVIGMTLYAPFGVDVTWEDRIVTRYGLFEIEGQPGPWSQPMTGWDAGSTMALRRVDG